LRGVIVDTGPLYAAYDPSDRYHIQAIGEVQQLETEDLVAIVPYPVFLETHSLILQRLGIQIGLRFIQEISTGAELIHPTLTDYELATQILQRFSEQTITLFDATTAALSQRLNLPVWTYDFHFDAIGARIWR
jgi:predicted nucleic acid-binding protein